MVNIKNMKKKVCLLGDAAVGKTSLIKRYVFDEFDDKYITTLGAKITKKDIQLNYSDNLRNPMYVNITLTIWDILGQKDESSLRVQPMYYKGANGALVICDITRKDTFESIPKWIKSFFNVVQMVPVVILGNKIDLYKDAEVFYDDLEDYVNTFQFPLYLTSAKINSEIEKAFHKLATLMIDRSISFE